MATRKSKKPSSKTRPAAKRAASARKPPHSSSGANRNGGPSRSPKATEVNKVEATVPHSVDRDANTSEDDNLSLEVLGIFEDTAEVNPTQGLLECAIIPESPGFDVDPDNENGSHLIAEEGDEVDEPTVRPPALSDNRSQPRQLDELTVEDAQAPVVAVVGDLLAALGDVRDTGAFLSYAIEALLFVSERPITLKELSKGLQLDKKRTLELLDQLRGEYANRGIRIDEVADGYAFRSNPIVADYVRTFLEQRPVRLSRAQLETLSIVAYRQPITRPEVDDIRGVDCGPVLKGLLERELVRILGKKDEPGRPMLYGTTPSFLELFGLKSLQELPTLREFAELNEDSKRKYEQETGEDPPLGLADLGLVSDNAEAIAATNSDSHLNQDSVPTLSKNEDDEGDEDEDDGEDDEDDEAEDEDDEAENEDDEAEDEEDETEDDDEDDDEDDEDDEDDDEDDEDDDDEDEDDEDEDEDEDKEKDDVE
jgi:segregation and condensation protein B